MIYYMYQYVPIISHLIKVNRHLNNLSCQSMVRISSEPMKNKDMENLWKLKRSQQLQTIDKRSLYPLCVLDIK